MSRDHHHNNIDMGNKDVKISLPSTINNIELHGGEWILATPYISFVSTCLLKCSSFDSHSSSPVTKARFVEAVFFASVVMVVILSAAAPEIYMLL